MKTLKLARPSDPTRSYAALAIVHNQARAHKAYMIRTALYVPLTTPSGVPYGIVERYSCDEAYPMSEREGNGPDDRVEESPRQVVYYHIGGGCVDSQGREIDPCND